MYRLRFHNLRPPSVNIHELWFTYFWPSLQGNGPEDLISYLIIGGGFTFLGKRALREWRVHKAKMDHIILNHPAIPNQVPGLLPEHQPKPAESPATPRLFQPSPSRSEGHANPEG